MEEIWTDIPTYEGLYQLSNLDRVKSLKYGKGRILKVHTNNWGYKQYSFYKEGVVSTKSLHVIKMMTYRGFVPNGRKIVVDHIDNDSQNNCLSNLQIITQRENQCKDRKNKTSKYSGVSLRECGNKWLAQIKINNKVKNLGLFTEEIDAHNAYQKALKEHNKE